MSKLPIWKKALIGISAIIIWCVAIFFGNIQIVKNQSEKLSINFNYILEDGEKLALLNLFSKEMILTNIGYMDAIVDKDSGEVDQDIIDQHNKFYKWVRENQDAFRNAMIDSKSKNDLETTFQEVQILKETAEKLFQSIKQKDSEEVFAEYDDVLDGTLDKVLERNNYIIEKINSDYQKLIKDSQNLSSSTELIQWISIIAMALFGGFVLWRLVLDINKSLNTVTEKIRNSAGQLRLEAESVSSTSVSLSSASNQQTSRLQETVSSIDEISSMVQRNAESAANSSSASQNSTTAADRGKRTVSEMIQSMKDISNSNDLIMNEVQNSNNQISQIVTMISEIGDKTKVINDIVFQTKLLSFNASVEAARAGEHGKGFAVVAEEVGNLAAMSGKAALEISDMLTQSIDRVDKIVSETKSKVERLIGDGKSKVESGEKTANDCGEALDEIYQNVIKVNELISEISNASSEQAIGIREVTSAMQDLDKTTHQNNSIALKSSEMAKSLEEQSDYLNSAVDELVKLVGSNNTNKAA